MSLVLTPSTTAQRTRLVRFGVLIFLTSLPIAGVLLALVNWQAALLYIVVWTVSLLFGVRQQRTTLLRVDDAGIQYEAGTFVLRAAWSDIERIATAELPSGKTLAFVLRSGTRALRWTQSAQVRQQVGTRGWDRIIPIDDYAPRWPAGRLGDAVRAHRPDLLPAE